MPGDPHKSHQEQRHRTSEHGQPRPKLSVDPLVPELTMLSPRVGQLSGVSCSSKLSRNKQRK